MFVQGTWGYDDEWWRPYGPFARAVTAKGHTVINSRPYWWDTEMGGIGFGDDDLRGWEAAGAHLYDRLQPPGCTCAAFIKPSDLIIIGHSHARQVIKFACHLGLAAAKVILVSGPVRKDVDRQTGGARANIGRLVCINGGRKDRMQIFGGAFDGHWGILRKDTQADEHQTFEDADHSSFLSNPAHFDYVLRFL
jgi:hypothetical protein